MKKFRISILLVVTIVSAVLYSCKQDSFSEEDAMNLQAQLDKQRKLDQDSLNTSTYRVAYTVNIVDASTSALKSASMVSAISGATVKFVQGDSIIVRTADASGIVAIGNVKPGLANVNITLANFSEVNYTVNLDIASTNGSREVTNIIPLIPIAGTATGTITGKVTCETDLTNKSVETVPAGTQVLAMVRTNSAALPSISGNIISISYDKLSLHTTTDASGNFSLTVPATVSGLVYDFIVSDFTANQKLLQSKYYGIDTTGVLTIPTSFGSSFPTASALSAGNPVTVTVSAPDYTFTPAAAVAVIDNAMSIDYIQNTNIGSYYKQGSYSYTIKNSTTGGADAVVTFVVDANGRGNAAISGTHGSKFAASADKAIITIPYILTPAKAVVNSVNGSGAILSYTVNALKAGEFFSTDNLQFVKQTGLGAGTVTQLPGTTSGASLKFNSTLVTLTTPVGSGFAANDSLVLTYDATKDDQYKGKIFLSTGSVSGINITNEGANYISGKVDVIIASPSALSGTTAIATAAVTNGKISTITVTPANAGSGYTTPPIVTIVNKAEKTQAKFTATVSADGKVTGFSPASSGNGYLTVPTVTLTSAIPGASGASAYATISGGTVSLVSINQGNGYTSNIPAAKVDFSAPSITVKGNATSIININLGTGKRTIEQ